ncbi:unnamed protein product, partial [marine sediment metagenome]
AKFWDPEYNQLFIGKKVFLIPDNDKDGQFFTQKIGENLIKVAERVQVTEIPKEYKDFSEWQASGENDNKRISWLDNKKWKPEKKEKKPASYQEGVKQGIQEALKTVIDGQELKEKKFEPGQFWISDGLIPKKGVAVLASYKGRGKTSLALMAALQLSKGNCKFLNTFEIKESPQKILYWYGENQPEEIQAIRNLQEESINLDLTKEQRRILSLMPREKLDFVQKKQIDIVKGTIKELSPDIIIIDTLGWFLPGKRLNDAQTYFYLYDVLREIKEDCFWLLITHNRKPS